jgi:hypothetical protein
MALGAVLLHEGLDVIFERPLRIREHRFRLLVFRRLCWAREGQGERQAQQEQRHHATAKVWDVGVFELQTGGLI